MGDVKQGPVQIPARPRLRSRKSKDLSLRARKALTYVMQTIIKRKMVASDSRSRLRCYNWLAREARGSNEDLRSPFFMNTISGVRKWTPREQVVNHYMKLIEKARDALHLPEIVHTYESNAVENVSSQSVYLPWSLDGPKKVAAIYRDKPYTVKNGRAWERAIEVISSRIPAQSCTISDISEVLEREQANPHEVFGDAMDYGTNSGLPHAMHPWKPREGQKPVAKADSLVAFDYIKSRSAELMKAYQEGRTMTLYAIVAKRLAQKKNPEKRKRIVIAIEKAQPVVGKCYTPQVYDALRQYAIAPSGIPIYYALLDIPSHDLAAQVGLRVAHEAKRAVLSGDYSNYDATLPPWLIEKAGVVISSWVKGGDKLVQAQVASMVNHTILVTPDRIWEATRSSMKSGDPNTNLLDSICNDLITEYGVQAGYYGEIKSKAVQGDDFWLDAEGIDPAIMETTAAEFGLDANRSKQEFYPDVLSFLQRIHVFGVLGGIFNTVRTLGSILSYEKMKYKPEEWSGLADVARAWAQLENCAFSPYFEVLVNYMVSGDSKYALGRGMNPREILSSAGNGAMDFIQSYYGGLNKDKPASGDVGDLFVSSAVSGVLNGETLPPLGSRARFSRVYGENRLQNVTCPALQRELNRF